MSNSYKLAYFDNQHYQVPAWAKWITQDDLGFIEVHELKPAESDFGWYSGGVTLTLKAKRFDSLCQEIL